MSNEELNQRKYLATGRLRGEKFGDFEELNIGSTSVRELCAVGVAATTPRAIDFPFRTYRPPRQPGAAKPDRVFLHRVGSKLIPVATAEHKGPTKMRAGRELSRALEQGLFAAAALGAPLAVATDGRRNIYVDVKESLATKEVVFFNETRDFGPGVLSNLLRGDSGETKDPKPLAETVWQMIWQATKEEPKACLLTFVEIFVLKFLSDNLPIRDLPEAYRFYSLTEDKQRFQDRHGVTAIEYYVSKIRPFIKTLFPDNVVAHDPTIPRIFNLGTVVSKTSVINGFAFLRSSPETLAGFNRTFLDILKEFEKFGPLTTIDPEFKIHLYETFLRRSARQQKLGQFFTPRTVVRSMIKMARLDTLPDGAVVLDPAAGVGGFVLEPPLLVPALSGNVTFVNGQPQRRIKLVGVDIDANTHILAKANTLLHFAEAVRDPATTMDGLNQLMADTFVLMNHNETLGALENPPQSTVDVVLTNPPYVTRGSGAVKDEVREAATGQNAVDLRDHYDRSGLGVEALFLRYIAEALKPGGRAYVIVPLGLLNRTDPGPKRKLLDDCNLLASIALPRNTFFNTAQLTYILAFQKRRTQVDERPDVFCGIARTIGESLNWERVPTPTDNDLDELAEAYTLYRGARDSDSEEHGEESGVELPATAKIVTADSFTENDRWDVARFWSKEELVALGLKEGAISRVEFIDEIQKEIEEIGAELELAKKEIIDLTSAPMAELSLSDSTRFAVRSGQRITGKQIRENPGDLPIYSCFRTAREIKGYTSAEFFTKHCGGVVETKPVVTVNANGASVGKVFVRRDRCGLTDDVIAVEVNVEGIDLDYMAIAMKDAVERGGFLYEAKLFARRVKELSVAVPTDQSGNFDLNQQRAIASAVKRFDALRTRLADLGERSTSVHAV